MPPKFLIDANLPYYFLMLTYPTIFLCGKRVILYIKKI